MGMDGFDHVADRAAHFDGQDGLANQVAGAEADDAAAEDALRLRDR